MKNIYSTLIILICFTNNIQAQEVGFTYSTKTIQVPITGVIDASSNGQDFDPKLLLIKSSLPMPVNEVKLKKLLLDQARTNHLTKQQNTIYEKTSAATPIMSTNFIANFTNGTPNDNDIAISNGGKIVSVSNTSLYFYNDTGLMIGQKSLSYFASKLSTTKYPLNNTK